MTTTAPSWQDMYDLGKAVLQSRNPKLLVLEGDVTDAVIAAAATLASALINYTGGRVAATFLDGAFGDDLKTLARDRGVEPDLGDEAVGTVTLSRATFAGGAGTLLAGFRVATEPDDTGTFQTFTLDTDAVFSGTDLTKTVNATCTTIGVAGNVASGTVTRLLDNAFDGTLVVTNASLFAGGSEEESDEELRDRVRGFFLTQARGTVDAIAYGAKTVPGVKRVNVIPDYPTGIVTVYVSDAAGNASPAMIAAVQAVMPNWAAAADIINVVGAVYYLQSVDVSITVRTGVDVTALEDKVRNAIVSRLNLLNPGETLFRDMISSAVRAVDSNAILGVIVNTPAANIAPTTGQVIRTDIAHVSFS